MYNYLCIQLSSGKYLGEELLEHMVTMFYYIRNCQNDFQNGWMIYISSRNVMSVSIYLHPHQHLVLSVIVIITVLIGMK